MKRINLIRLGGMAAMVGGVLYAVLGLAIVPVMLLRSSPVLPESFDNLFRPLLVLLLLGVIATIAALHALLRRRYGSLGTLSFLVAFVGLALMLVGAIGGDDLPLLAANLEGGPPSTAGYFFLVGLLIASIGILALGIVLLMKDEEIAAHGVPWWCGAALIAGSPPFGLLYYLFFPLGEDFLVGVAWAVVGYAVFRAGTRQNQQPSRVR